MTIEPKGRIMAPAPERLGSGPGEKAKAPLLSVRQLVVDFRTDAGDLRAVDGLSLDIPAGRTVAVVGESGSGKSVTAQAIMRILPKAAHIGGGSIIFRDPAGRHPPVDIASLEVDSEEMRALRARERVIQPHRAPAPCGGV